MKKLIAVLFLLYLSILACRAQDVEQLIDSAGYYYSVSDFEKAIDFGKKALPLIKEKYGVKDTNNIECLYYISSSYFNNGNIDSAINYGEKQLELSRELFEPDHDYLINAIGNLALIYTSARKFDEAEPLFKEALGKLRKKYGGDHPGLAKNLNNMADFYYSQNNYELAEKYYLESLEMKRRLFEVDNPELASSINNMATFYSAMGRFEEAEALFSEALELFRRIYPGDNPDLAILLSNLGYFYQKQGKYDKAEPLLREYLEMTQRLYDGDNQSIASAYSSMGNFYSAVADFKKSGEYFRKAIQMYRRLVPEGNAEMATVLENAGVMQVSKGDYDAAEKLLIESFELKQKFFKAPDPKLLYALNNLGYFYDVKGELSLAEDYYNRCYEMAKELYKSDHPIIASAMNNLAVFYDNNGLLIKAGNFYRRALEMNRRLYEEESPELANTINNMASFYHSCGLYAESEKLYIESLKMNKKIFGEAHPAIAVTLNNLGNLYNDLGNYEKAEQNLLRALEIYEEFYDGDHADITNTLNNIGILYEKLGRMDAAKQYLTKSYEMRERLYENDHPSKVVSLMNLASYSDTMKEYDMAQNYLLKSYDMCKRLYGGDHPALASVLDALGRNFNQLKKFEESEKYFENSLDMKFRLYGSDHPDIAQSLNNLGYLYHKWGKRKKADSLMQLSYQMMRRMYRPGNPNLTIASMNIAAINFINEDYEKAEEYFEKGINSFKEILVKNFPYMSEKEKSEFLSTVDDNFESFNSFAVNKNTPRHILKFMFDNRLMLKGILLNSTQKIKKRIFSSNDTLLMNSYYDLMATRESLSKLYGAQTDDNLWEKNTIDSLENAANEIEKELSRRSEDFRSVFEKKTYTFDDINSALEDDEAAVEIVRFSLFDKDWTDTVYYAALIAARHLEVPALVLFKNGNDLEGIHAKNYERFMKMKLQDEGSYKLYWQPVADKLKSMGIKKAYLSPDGVYNQINIETLLNPETGEYVFDEFDIQITGSLKDILEKPRSKPPSKTAVLIGNPEFNAASPVKQHQDKNRNLKANLSELSRGIRDLFAGGAINPLPGTEKEISQISGLLTENGYQVRTYTGAKAREEIIKELDNPGILHIATHGIFMEDITSRDKSDDMLQEHDQYLTNPLLRSMLLLTGAENTLKYGQNKSTAADETEEDGLLTAYEAQNLNLDNTELVVLSACETGLGEIKNGEGVYGLQRAFKVAGAKSLIMSLWNVSDKATQELMDRFYENWLSGQSKREAFRNAQMELREKYKHPYYWGAFVMVGE